MQRSTAALLLLALAACSGPTQSSRPPAERSAPEAAAEEPVEPAPASSEEQLVSLLEALAADLPPAGECDAYAASLDGWMEDHADEVRELAGETERRSELEQTELASLERRLQDALDTVLQGAAACTENERAQTAFTAFDEMLLGG